MIIDRLNVVWRKPFGLPVTVKAGRQDIKLGEGWLVLEGNPRDGSRTLFFDAIRLTADLPDIDTTVDLIYIDNHRNSSWWIRPFNDADLDLVEQDERGAIVWVTNKSIERSRIDGYFIYKRDHNPNAVTGVSGETYTFGAALTRSVDEHWKYHLEAAPQFGNKNGKSVCAFAANTRLSYHFLNPTSSVLHFGYDYLSGDEDPNQNFDKLWGRIAMWSNLYTGPIDSIDGRSDDSSNLHRIYGGFVFEPIEKAEILAYYHLLFADEQTPAAGTSRHGRFRGQLLTSQFKYTFNKHLTNRVNFELFCPGNFYNSDLNDPAVFLRYEVVVSW